MWIKTKILCSIEGEPELDEVDAWYNMGQLVSVVRAHPKGQRDIPAKHRRFTWITLKDGREYGLKVTPETLFEFLNQGGGGITSKELPESPTPVDPIVTNKLNLSL